MEQLGAKIDELAATQKQVTQNIATLQAVDHDISQKTSSHPAGASATVDAGQQVNGQKMKTSSAPTSASTAVDAGQQVSDKCDIEACKQA